MHVDVVPTPSRLSFDGHEVGHFMMGSYANAVYKPRQGRERKSGTISRQVSTSLSASGNAGSSTSSDSGDGGSSDDDSGGDGGGGDDDDPADARLFFPIATHLASLHPFLSSLLLAGMA